MKWILVLIIKFYWKIIPETKRRRCLFKESCSHFVYKQAVEHGFFKGIKALIMRIKQCRSGYHIYIGKNGYEMKLADGSTIYENEISSQILNHKNLLT